MGSIRTGFHPDFALAPDGRTLYVASNTDARSSELDAVDTSNGTVLGGPAIQQRAVPTVIPSYSTMAVSGDGQLVRILVRKPTGVEFQLDGVDTRSGVLLPNHLNVKHCGDGQFVSFPTADRVDVVCPEMKKIHMARTDSASKQLDDPYVEFPWNHKMGLATAFPAPDGKYITIVRGDGAVFEMDAVSLSFYPTSAHGSAFDRVYQANWPVSPDGSRVYLGFSRYLRSRGNNTLADEFRVYDTSSWRKIGTIKTSVPFWSATTSDDGRSLYVLAPEIHSILVIDTATRRQVRSISVGGMPALALVAP